MEKHICQIQVRFGDTDKLGHINNANYLTYVESARIQYFIDIIGDNINWDKEGIILARATIDFISPIELSDRTVEVHSHCSRIGTKSFDLTYSIFKSNTNELAAQGVTTLVGFNYQSNSSIVIPTLWRNKMEPQLNIQ